MNSLWNTTPANVEELMVSLGAIKFYEVLYGEPPSLEDSIVLTNDLLLDIVKRLLALENGNA